MRVEQCGIEHLQQWLALRAALWPDHAADHHKDEVLQIYLAGCAEAAAFICRTSANEAIGFAEATLRKAYVNGCQTSPVLFLEGIYVRSEHRQRGVARLLCDSVAIWGKSAGCVEFASDALIDNAQSHGFHLALGFLETERVVYFRKNL